MFIYIICMKFKHFIVLFFTYKKSLLYKQQINHQFNLMPISTAQSKKKNLCKSVLHHKTFI